jgi:peptidoglycan/LPS O-acetylase OafA/YrhL
LTSSTLQLATTVKHHRFHFLDALRGVAAVLVIMRHAPIQFSHSLLSLSSFLAVDFFFCLSGFVVAFSYEERLGSFLCFKDFTVARIIRLYPVAALGTVIGAIEALGWYLHTHPADFSLTPFGIRFILGLLVLPDFFTKNAAGTLFPFDGVMWTLFFELVANLAYATLIRLRLGQTKVITGIAATSLFLLGLERVLFNSFNTGFTRHTAPIALIRVAVSFSIGVLIFRLFKHLKRQSLHDMKALFAALAISAALVFLLCNSLAVMQSTPFELLILAVLFPLIVFLGSHIRLSSRWILPCAFLGDISYPLYILHPPLFWPLNQSSSMNFASHHGSETTSIMLGYALIVVVIAWCAARFYDAPLRKTLTKAYRSRQLAESVSVP